MHASFRFSLAAPATHLPPELLIPPAGPVRTLGDSPLRAGFLTSAARRGASVFKMRDVSRHKSMDVLQAYVRDADLFRDHAGAGLL
jgi:hypothetical protein